MSIHVAPPAGGPGGGDGKGGGAKDGKDGKDGKGGGDGKGGDGLGGGTAAAGRRAKTRLFVRLRGGHGKGDALTVPFGAPALLSGAG